MRKNLPMSRPTATPKPRAATSAPSTLVVTQTNPSIYGSMDEPYPGTMTAAYGTQDSSRTMETEIMQTVDPTGKTTTSIKVPERHTNTALDLYERLCCKSRPSVTGNTGYTQTTDGDQYHKKKGTSELDVEHNSDDGAPSEDYQRDDFGENDQFEADHSSDYQNEKNHDDDGHNVPELMMSSRSSLVEIDTAHTRERTIIRPNHDDDDSTQTHQIVDKNSQENQDSVTSSQTEKQVKVPNTGMIGMLTNTLNELSRQMIILKNENEELKNQAEHDQAKINAQATEIENLRIQLLDRQCDIQVARKSLDDQKQRHDLVIQELQKQLEAFKTGKPNTNDDEQHQRSQQEISRLNRSNEKLQSRISTLENNYQKLNAYSIRMEGIVEEKEALLAEAQKQLITEQTTHMLLENEQKQQIQALQTQIYESEQASLQSTAQFEAHIQKLKEQLKSDAESTASFDPDGPAIPDPSS